ncbi:polyprenyl synthetase family protein [Lachnospiraceae bacterium MD1]|jgi:heptaprenyl diphosphate synthase|uniref:Polyprenyl synthetase family protein n=2 Tax=Variimorphobacter saccharofermentans TaxID=2755051 RepID=A0A839JYY3_9FIRM|nr:polyprenyl synthetase family protein [Variimorphobacter saccharofermentans]
MIKDYKNDVENFKLIEYEAAMNQVNMEFDKALSGSPRIIREYTKHLLNSRGKFIRALSVLICAENQEGLVHPNAVTAAVAIEILHLASLVHDDIIDNADLRRGDVTLQKKYGKRTAVICGDYLLSIALRMMANIPNKKDYLDLEMPDYVGRLCLGELEQHINNFNINLTIYRYLKIISGKTAALFEASFYAGAIFSGASEKEIKRYKQLGFYIGMIFQLTDDCMDFEKTVEVANKPVQSDYEQGVITLPLIHALAEEKSLKEKASNQGLTRAEINDAVRKTEGLQFTRMVVKKYYNKSLKIINELDLSESKKERLTLVLNKATRLS